MMDGGAVVKPVSERCPCGAARYAECCAPLHRGMVLPETAEQLMRSRYSAFALGLSNYLFTTWHPRTRPDEVDAGDTRWTGLKILDVVDGEPWDSDGIVEFVARYEGGELRERSAFAKRAGRWFYVEAVR